MSESISISIASAACLTQLSSCASLVALCIADSIFFASSIRSLRLSRMEKSEGSSGRSFPSAHLHQLSLLGTNEEQGTHLCRDWP